MKLKVILESENEGGFRAYVPTLPGCTSHGRSEDETLMQVRHSILAHLGIEEVTRSNN